VRVNTHGWRDVEHDWAKPSGRYRILLVGDSFVEAMHVPLEETWCRRLEEQLKRAGPSDIQFEVLCAGVSGWGTASELLWVRAEGLRYAPDLVLLSFYPGNDLKNNSPQLEDTLRPEYDEHGQLLRVVSTKQRRRGPTWSERFRLLAFVRQRLAAAPSPVQSWLARVGVVAGPPKNPAADEHRGYPEDYGVYEVPWAEPWRDAWGRTAQLLQGLRETVQNHGAQFAVVVVAGREQTDPRAWERILETYPAMKGRSWDLEAPQRAVLDWCEQERVACVPLLPAFRAAQEKGRKPLHFLYDGHWTATGHAVAAEAVSEFILANWGALYQKRGLNEAD
jgi:hypothetical protein